MALPFLNGASRKKRNQVIAVDLGARTSKAVLIERRGEVLALLRYALADAPIYGKKFTPEALTTHLQELVNVLGTTCKSVVLSIGSDAAIVRPVELPQIPADEMRQLLRLNAKNILQQDLPNHVFDCHIFPPRLNDPKAGKKDDAAKQPTVPKLKVLVAAARQQLMLDYAAAIKGAGLIPEAIVPGLIGPLNAFELALPQIYESESVALVDVGFNHSAIYLLDRGELVLTRGVNIGGDKLTAGLAEAMNISYAEAEGIKIGLAPEAQSALESQVAPLGRELRASLDFFEHQQDRPVSQVYVCGAAARSEMFLEMLRAEMILECKTWNPTTFLQLALRGEQAVEIEHLGPQLTVAIGAAVAAL
ncbi:MAG TPA: pilus assembly protein PilM [Desulfuromonadaceae bacterium]|nr:pilus assembly protein PilM [Desulfuromonadaceae bacterium]